jgi:hypothetical protein
LLAVMLRSTPPDKSAPADSAAAALEPVQSPVDALPAIPGPPVNISALRVEQTDTQLDRAQTSSAPAAPMPARGTEHQLAKKTAHHTSAPTGRKTHAFAVSGSPFVIHGVLTPPDATARHNDGY